MNTTPQSTSIVSALDNILSACCHSELDEKEIAKAEDSFLYITEKLSITRMQAMIIGMLIESGDSLQTKNMATYLGINNISFLRYIKELDELVERKIIRKGVERGDKLPSYEIREEAREAFMHNEVFTAPKRKNLTLNEFIEISNRLFDKCNEENISKQELQNEIAEMTNLNQALFLCKGLNRLHIYDQLFFYYCADKFVIDNDTHISPMEITEFTNPLVSRKLAGTLERGKNDLIVQQLVQHSGKGGFGDKETFTISDTIKERLIAELNLEPTDDKEEYARGLRPFDLIPEKQLYYNAAEAAAIEELTTILSPDHFSGVQRRLEDHGMRKGFACIFYGTPGTGKTESVLQLARTTGRDLMEVNIATIKSKWVGDSEKNIKQIFNRYRDYCEHCDTLPILLFNEADAIISKRGTHVERSVDKMENAIQNIILEEMEKLDGILIATTNLTSNMDTAFERRFLYKVEFKNPELEARVRIWQSMLPELSEEDVRTLAEAYDFSGGQIENIARKEIINNILHDTPATLEQLRSYCDSERLSPQTLPARRIGFC